MYNVELSKKYKYSFYQNWGFIFLTLLKDNIENFSDFCHLPPVHY
jgi:hypothetical protein